MAGRNIEIKGKKCQVVWLMKCETRKHYTNNLEAGNEYKCTKKI